MINLQTALALKISDDEASSSKSVGDIYDLLRSSVPMIKLERNHPW